MSGRLVVCPECDALHHRRPLAVGAAATCARCGAVIYRAPRLQPQQVLALTLAALLSFAIANGFPIVDLQVQGVWNGTTLLGSIATLWREGRQPVALLVLATGFLLPLADLLAMAAVLLPASRGRPLGRRSALLRWLIVLRPWAMTEVFMLATLVSVAKLTSIARVVPGAALWAFAALTLLLAVVASFDPRSLWDPAEPDARR